MVEKTVILQLEKQLQKRWRQTKLKGPCILEQL